jgi:hypothetical protein
VGGMSSKLRATVIGDYLKHEELLFLEEERIDYFKKKEEALK